MNAKTILAKAAGLDIYTRKVKTKGQIVFILANQWCFLFPECSELDASSKELIHKIMAAGKIDLSPENAVSEKDFTLSCDDFSFDYAVFFGEASASVLERVQKKEATIIKTCQISELQNAPDEKKKLWLAMKAFI